MKRELIDDILDPNYNFDKEEYSSQYINSICLNCGKTDNIPDFIYDECSRKKYHLRIKKKVATLECGFCGKETVIPSNLLKK